jgi:hypothetical protein
MSPEEEAELWRRGEAAMITDLSRRGMLDSGLLPGGRAALVGQIGLAKAQASQPFKQALINAMLQSALAREEWGRGLSQAERERWEREMGLVPQDVVQMLWNALRRQLGQ